MGNTAEYLGDQSLQAVFLCKTGNVLYPTVTADAPRNVVDRHKYIFQFGGEKGVILSVKRGDVVIIPAGVAHNNLGASQDFRVVGAYPLGQRADLNDGKSGERPQADENIAHVALPELDPVYGAESPLTNYWMEQGE